MKTPPAHTGRLSWYVRRLGSMAPGEVLWRGQRWAAQRLPRRDPRLRPSTALLRPGVEWSDVSGAFRSASGRPLLLDRTRAQNLAADHPEAVAALVTAADRVRAGYVSYFGYPEAPLATPVDWNHDPLRAFHWPSRDSRAIDHRVAVADPKWIWELNRLQHLPWLAETWLFTGDNGFAELALDHLDTWMDQNPVGIGIAWRGAFEAGLRAISVAVALQGLRDAEALTSRRFERIVGMLAASADLCWRERSRFSSANNHLIGELAGLATVAMLFPELTAARRWEHRALDALDLEASRQILPDGAGAEQAVGYQVFTAELMGVVAALLRARGDVPPAGILSAIDRSADYLAVVVGENDPDPRYGDDDEGFAMRLGPESRRTVRDHLGIVGALTGNNRARDAGNVTLSALWIDAMCDASDPDHLPRRVSLPSSAVAPHGGLVILRSGSRRLTMDIGPLGYLSIAAHGHSDALSVTLSIEGQDVIGDPGAASYYGHPEWRQIHRGTLVHPTVSVNGESQSVSGGPFMWTKHARVRVRSVQLERGIVDAEHDGYRRFPRPVIHRRWLVAPPEQGEIILIVDEVSGPGGQEMQVAWPLHPSLDIDEFEGGYTVTRKGLLIAQISTAAPTEVDLYRIRGDHNSGLGWWSNRLEARDPSWLMGAVTRGSMPLVIATTIGLPQDTGHLPTDVAVSQVGEVITVSWRTGGKRHAVIIDRSRAGAVDFQSPAV